jgi:hypothetical protein
VLAVTPRDAWEAKFRELGFSAPAARSYAAMTAASVDEDYALPERPERGPTTLHAYVAALARLHLAPSP